MSIEIIERLGPYEERTKKHEYENINKGTYIQSIHTSTKLWTSRWRPRPCLPHPTPTAHHRDPTPTCPAKNVYTIYDKTETYGHSTEMKNMGTFKVNKDNTK